MKLLSSCKEILIGTCCKTQAHSFPLLLFNSLSKCVFADAAVCDHLILYEPPSVIAFNLSGESQELGEEQCRLFKISFTVLSEYCSSAHSSRSQLHAWLLSWRASASLLIQPTLLTLCNSLSVNITTRALCEHMYLIGNVSARLSGCIACAHLSRTKCQHCSVCSLDLSLPAVVFQSSDATGQSPILSISFRRGWESRCSIRPAGKMPQLQPDSKKAGVL